MLYTCTCLCTAEYTCAIVRSSLLCFAHAQCSRVAAVCVMPKILRQKLYCQDTEGSAYLSSNHIMNDLTPPIRGTTA